MQQRYFRPSIAFGLFVCALAPAILLAVTVQNFDTAGTAFATANYQSIPLGPNAPGITAGGPAGNFFRLTDNTVNGSAGSRTAIAFPLTASGAKPKLVANFDFNLNSAISGGGNGFSFIILPTAIYGTNGLPTLVFSEDTRFEEPNLPGALAVAFDTFGNTAEGSFDPSANHISLHYDGQFLQAVNPGFSLLNGKWNRAAIEIDFVAGTLTLVVIEDVFGASPLVRPIFDAKKILCVQPFEARLMFGAHTSTNRQRTDLDNINVIWSSGATTDSTDTTQGFNGCGTDFTEDNFGGNASLGVTNFGAPINFYRLADNQIDPFGDAATNSITFDRTRVGNPSKVTMDFDFNINGSAGTGFGNGFGFVLLPTSSGGISGTPTLSAADPTRFEEPNHAGALGIGFDTLNNSAEGSFDPNGNHLSLHWNGALVAIATNLGFSLANGLWNHARIQIDFAAQSVSVILNEDIYGANISRTVLTNRNVPGLASYEGRALFGARCGGARENVDLDNIVIQFDPVARPLPSLSATRTMNRVSMAWSLFDAAFRLEQKTNWNSAVWTVVTNAPAVTNNTMFVSLSPTNAAGFFRLRK